MAYNQRVFAWGDDQAVPRVPRQDRPPGPGHPNHPANQVPANLRPRLPAPERPQEEADADQGDNQDGDDFVFKGSTHPDMVLSGLNVLRKENTFTDVRIKVDEVEFPVHKCVLSSFSPYFKVLHILQYLHTC